MSTSFEKRSSIASLREPLAEDRITAKVDSSRDAVRLLTSAQTQACEAAAKLCGTSLENFFLTGFAALLTRRTQQEMLNISVGQIEVASFALEGDCTFRQAAAQSFKRTSAGLAQTKQRAAQQGMQYEFWSVDVPVSEASLPVPVSGLRLAVFQGGSALQLSSSSGLWPSASLEAWLNYLTYLLHAAALSPDLPIVELPLWEPASAQAFYAALNATDVEFSGPASVAGRIAIQALRRGDATAVIGGARQYTYRDVDSRSAAIARKLIAAGAGPNQAVAICMERSADLPVALLAILKSGSFYVPLDPHIPALRLQGILEECTPVVLISDEQTADAIKTTLEITGVPHLLIDSVTAETSAHRAAGAQQTESEFPPGEGSDLAYTIYTSGTTGKPKGVRILRSALRNYLSFVERTPGIQASDRTLAVAPISFDIATMDMFLPLITGGTLVIASRSDALDPFRLAALIKEHDITVMQATPATWRMLTSTDWTGKLDLRMFSGGEALPRELANDLIRLGSELWNFYGPTETTIYSSVLRLELENGIVPIGRPLANTSFYVVDKGGNPLPPGVPGELYIGGRGVSPGYVARPELTTQRFIPDRFGSHTGGTLFRTGDLVRLIDGNKVEFFGRLDHQVKLRGFRIELGEIESVLRSHPSIADAVVILREDVAGEPRLVAYVTSSRAPFDAAVLLEHTAQSLPEYMLPARIIRLEKFPLSNAGKIDRKSLPTPESLPELNAHQQPKAELASGELELKLLKIFREVLKNDSLGVTDSFFRFGGYSLLTVRLFSRIDRELHVRLPISLLFDAPTVRELAQVIERGITPSVIVPIRPQGRSAPIFLIQSYLLYGAMLDIVEPDRPIYGVREMGDERGSVTVEERARRFAAEILRVSPDGPIQLAGWCAAATLTVEIARQLREAGHKVGIVALFDAERPGFAPPPGIKAWFSRLRKKTAFHLRRIHSIPWSARFTYIFEAVVRNWDLAVETFYSAHYRSMLWLHRHFGLSLSEAAFNNVYASLSALNDFSFRPYPGRLDLFRAADVPDISGPDQTLGWSIVARKGVTVNYVPGDHVTMFKSPHIFNLAERLQSEMKKSENAGALSNG